MVDESSGETFTYKTRTTPHDPSEAVIEGLGELLASAEGSAEEIAIAIHGTTLIANALIERKGAKTALVTTDGFRDILEMRTEMRYDIYDLFMRHPEPLVPRERSYGLKERLDRDGNVLVEVEREQLREIAADLGQHGVESIAICLLHAFRNPSHEQVAREELSRLLPAVSISLSSEVAPEIREFERASTTAANAYVQPLAERYLERLAAKLSALGYRRPLYLMLSSGGITTALTSSRFPIRMAESGPAAGALEAAFYGRQAGIPDLLSFDMGGTTAKACLIASGSPAKTGAFEIARVQRFRKGSGLPVRVPAIDLIEIGAGGGSIAWIDDLGLLKVGPRSAGADPGPACYGFGGTEPTVTDADLVLGLLNPDYFLGGRMVLSVQAARQAIERRVAEPLGLTAEEAAVGIFRIVNEDMVAAAKTHAVERGADPRHATLLAFGGAGPVHAYEIARALKLPGMVIPPGAGAASALGFLIAPASFDLSRSFVSRLDRLDLGALHRVFSEMAEEGKRVLIQAGVSPSEVAFTRSAEMRHKGQGHEITVDLGDRPIIDAERLRQLFYRRYRSIYGYAHEHLPVELITCRLTARGPEPRVPSTYRVPPGGGTAALKGHRPVYFPECSDFVSTPIYDRYRLMPGWSVAGPVIVEEGESTAVVGPSADVRLDEHGALIVVMRSKDAEEPGAYGESEREID